MNAKSRRYVGFTALALVLAAISLAADYKLIYIDSGNSSTDSSTLSYMQGLKPENSNDTYTVVEVSGVNQANFEIQNSDAYDGTVVWAHGNDDGPPDPSGAGNYSYTIHTADDPNANPSEVSNNVPAQVIFCGRNGFDVTFDRAAEWTANEFSGRADSMDSETTYYR